MKSLKIYKRQTIKSLRNYLRQKKILKSADAKECYEFARYVEGADIKALQDAVIKSGDAKYCYFFARYIEGADVEALQEAIIESRNPEYCCKFAEVFSPSNENSILKSYSEAYKSGEEEDLEMVDLQNESSSYDDEDLFIKYMAAYGILKLKNRLPKWMPLRPNKAYFSKPIIIFQKVNIEVLEYIVIKYGDAKLCYEFARYVKGAYIKPLQDIVIKSGNAKYCYYFARYIKKADIEALQEAVIKSGDAKFCYYFAMNVTNSDVEKLCKAIAKSNDVKYCQKAILNLKLSNYKEILSTLINHITPKEFALFIEELIKSDLNNKQEIIQMIKEEIEARKHRNEPEKTQIKELYIDGQIEK